MLLVLFRAWRDRDFLYLIIIGGSILFYAFYSYIDRDENVFLSLVRGQRFLLPAASILLIVYAKSLSKIQALDRFFHKFFILFLLLGCLTINSIAYFHSEHARSNVRANAWVYGLLQKNPQTAVVYNVDSAEFVHGIYGRGKYFMLQPSDGFERKLKSVSNIFDQILVVETDHIYRKGDRFFLDSWKKKLYEGFVPVQFFETKKIRAVFLKRGAVGVFEGKTL